jgi:broad specificity phosphatase PhoE
MAAPLTIYLLRHGEVHNPQKILYGRLPGFGLSSAGIAQAQAAGAALRDQPLAALYASPMQRAQETAQQVAAARSAPLPIRTDERLNEVFTPHQGRPLAELELTAFDLYTGNQPPYEQVHQVRGRLQHWLAEMRHRHAGQAIAAVTHGDAVVLLFMLAHRQPADDVGRGRLLSLGLPEPYPATASISTLTFSTPHPDEIPAYAYVRPW